MLIPRSKQISICLVLSTVTLLFLSFHPGSRNHLSTLASNFPLIGSNSVLDNEYGGIVTVPSYTRVHPIYKLIERGKKEAIRIEGIRASVRSLEDAVRDYKLAFKMDPPEGFDNWYELAKALNSTTAPSLLPLAHKTVLPFLALPPALLRRRVKDSISLSAMCGLLIDPGVEDGQVELVGLDGISSRRDTPKQWRDMVEQDINSLPSLQDRSEPMLLAVWADDSSFRMAAGDIVQNSIKLAQMGQTWDIEELEKRESQAESLTGWASTCPPDVLVETSMEDGARLKRFVVDQSAAGDYCKHPPLLQQNGELIMREHLPMRPLSPAMVIGRPLHGIDMIGPPTQAFNNTLTSIRPWGLRNDSRLLWRGQPSGIYHIDHYPWQQGQRDRLSSFVDTRREGEMEVLVDNGKGSYTGVIEGNISTLTQNYLDIGMIKENIDWHQFACHIDEKIRLKDCPGTTTACETMQEEHQWKERVNAQDGQRYKFVLDVDGYGWSVRWRRELSSRSVIVKSTIYVSPTTCVDKYLRQTEWWSEQAIPWYHYVPSLYDYKDLIDIMAFFTGPPDGSHPGREDLAKEIAQRGREFALDQLKWEDMRVYMLLLVLEYRRAWSDDRAAATFHL